MEFTSLKNLIVPIVVGTILFYPFFISAHGTGRSFEKVVGEYLVDVGYDEGPLLSGQPVQFDFRLFVAETEATADFTDVWVRVAQGTDTTFAGGLKKADIGPTAILLSFPRAGEYELFVRYQNGSEKLAEATFSLLIEAGVVETRTSNWLVGVIPGLLVGIVVTIAIYKFRKRS